MRDGENGRWLQKLASRQESYLSKRSGLQFTYALCPSCKNEQLEGFKQTYPA